MENKTLLNPEIAESESQSIVTDDDIQQKLFDADIDVSLWGEGQAKTLSHLVNEINEGETLLEMDKTGELVRRVAVGRADVFFTDTDGQTYRLREDRQIFKDGRTRRRTDIEASLSEKMKFHEDPETAMIRGIQEELGISGGVALESTGTDEERMTSPSYPGLTSEYTSINFKALLTEKQYKPEGYIERQQDKDTYFVWDKVEDDHANLDEHKNLLGQLHLEEASEEERAHIQEKFSGLVEKILEWADKSGVTIGKVRRLGGGFKNPVIMLTTSEGESFVAKGFAETEALETTIHAQEVFSRLSKNDELRLIPRSEIMDGVLFSEKAEGVPIKALLEQASSSPEALNKAKAAFRALGATLGYIHESTERVIDPSQSADEDIVQDVLVDRQKMLKHIDELSLQSLLGLDDVQVEALKYQISNITTPEYIAVIHADAHLDQFFYGEGSLVEIVDYDDVREGDPMADLGRAIASLRDWCRSYDIDFDTEIELTRSIARGYEHQRKESGLGTEQEMDSMRAVGYEMRLYLVQLKQHSELREKLSNID
ncbi:hypothetical protein BH23PAT2_BH23PAT2_10170 [soil metagenome]